VFIGINIIISTVSCAEVQYLMKMMRNLHMNLYDLINILEDNLMPEEIVEYISDFLNLYDVETHKRELREYAISKYICPECCERLVMDRWLEGRGEYWGSPAQEEMGELICNNCSWRENDYY